MDRYSHESLRMHAAVLLLVRARIVVYPGRWKPHCCGDPDARPSLRPSPRTALTGGGVARANRAQLVRMS
jgi:hypothetical protein